MHAGRAHVCAAAAVAAAAAAPARAAGKSVRERACGRVSGDSIIKAKI